jgi:hypothetical protein
MVAQVFADLLHEPAFANHFHQVTFAVFDTTSDLRVIRPFQAMFG